MQHGGIDRAARVDAEYRLSLTSPSSPPPHPLSSSLQQDHARALQWKDRELLEHAESMVKQLHQSTSLPLAQELQAILGRFAQKHSIASYDPSSKRDSVAPELLLGRAATTGSSTAGAAEGRSRSTGSSTTVALQKSSSSAGAAAAAASSRPAGAGAGAAGKKGKSLLQPGGLAGQAFSH